MIKLSSRNRMLQEFIVQLPWIIRNELFWTTINRSRRVSVAQVIIFYPAFAFALRAALRFNVHVPFFAKSVFFGMVLYSLSLLVFYARCPGAIKKYDTAIEFFNAEVEHFVALGSVLKQLVRDADRALSDGPEKLQLHKRFASERPMIIDASRRTISATQARVLMDYLWHAHDLTRPVSRVVAASAHWAGLIMITAPSFWAAAKIMWILIQPASGAL